MALQSAPLLNLSLKAQGAITKRRAVTFAGAQATVAGSKVMGVALEDSEASLYFPCVVCGTVVVESGAAIAVGNGLVVDASGRAVPASALTVAAGATAVTSSAANGAILAGSELPAFIFADAMEAATAAGQFIEVLLRR